MLTYTIPKNPDIPIYEYLYRCIRDDILNGHLKAEEKLPSKRSIAEQLKISLITVEHAYDLLLTEGYIYALPKKGYYVETVEIEKTPKKNKLKEELILSNNKEIKDPDFPYNIWSKLTRKVLSDNISINPTPFGGDPALRNAIAKHLYEFHELSVSPDSIIIGAGSEYLYSLLIQYFGLEKRYVLENPGHRNIADIYSLNSAKFEYIDLDENGLDVNKLNKTKADIVHISPAHHYPTGITMPLKRRLEILKWAKKAHGYIIEDDYDSEFRISSRPIPPLYQLDHNSSVIYMNTFSKSLSSSLRIAYMVLPDSLVKDFNDKLGFYHNTVSALEQKVLAEFIAEGYFERLINRKRKRYRQIHEKLIAEIKVLAKKFNLELRESDSGLHFIIEHHLKINDKELKKKVAGLNLPCRLLSDYLAEYRNTHKLIISYADMSIEDIPDFIEKLDSLLKDAAK